MVKIEALINPLKLADTKAALEILDVQGITVSEVLDHASPQTISYRGSEYRVPVSRIKLEMLVSSDDVDAVTAALMRAARTKTHGAFDGRILVYEIADAISIHSGAHLQYSLP